MKDIITIGRQYGTGGHELGEKLAARLGFTFYNKDLISKLAENLMIPENVVMKAEGKMPKKTIFHEVFHFWSHAATEEERYIFEEQGKFIRKLANEGKCVFAGRRADYYLKDYPNALHLFFYAPLESRIKRVVETENLSEAEAEKKIDAMDKMRRNSYEYTTGRKWGDPQNYSLMVNTASISIDEVLTEVVNLICNSK